MSAMDLELPLPGPPATPGERLRWAVADGLTVARRNLAQIRQVPEKLLDVTIQPIMFVLLFAYVFGSAIKVPGGGNYRDYLMAGMFAQALFGTFGSTAVGFADDMAKGLIDRFRSLPMARSAMLVGRTLADLAAAVLGLLVTAGVGLLIGWRPHDGVARMLAAFALVLLFGFAMSWVGTYVGLIVRTPDTAQVVGFLIFLPFGFVSNAFVPTQGMPTVVRTFAEWNPLSAIVGACRQLFGSPGADLASGAWPMQHPIVASLVWSLLILAIFAPLAIRRYRTAIAR